MSKARAKATKEPIFTDKDIENICGCIGATLIVMPLVVIYWAFSYMEYLEAIKYGILQEALAHDIYSDFIG